MSKSVPRVKVWHTQQKEAATASYFFTKLPSLKEDTSGTPMGDFGNVPNLTINKYMLMVGQDTLLRKALDFGNNILLFSVHFIECFPYKWHGKIFFHGMCISLYPKKKTHGSCVLAETILSIDNNIIVVDWERLLPLRCCCWWRDFSVVFAQNWDQVSA